MDSREVAFAPALELARLVRERTVSPVELVDLFGERIEALDPMIGAYLTVALEEARAEAKRAEAACAQGARDDLPAFWGVPVSIKDVIDTAGIRTTFGTAAWAERVPTHDAAVVAKLKQAGCIVIGKTNVPEFSGALVTEPLAYRPCRNPWNLDFSPGGSSGGAAAALAAGLCPIALGTDDGGSIRIPAGWCGVFGIKPTRGRVSAAPDPQAMEFTPGPLARSVADAAAMLDAISGYVTGDGFWAPPPERPFAEEVERSPGRLRIAFTTRGADDVEVAPGNIAAVERTAKVLEECGHHLEEVPDWPGRGMFPDERAMPLHVMYGAKYAGMVARGLMPALETLEPVNQVLVQLGQTAPAPDYIMANRLSATSSREVVGFFDDHDTLLTPVMASQPPRVGEFAEHPEESMRLLRAVQFTAQFSRSGQPAVSIPAGLDDDGLPVGVQLVGRPADEATLIRLSAQLEMAQPWADRVPPDAAGAGKKTRP